MPKHLQARPAQDEREERQVRKLAGSHHAPADWKFHAQMVVESWAGKTPQEIASTLSCHPRTVRILYWLLRISVRKSVVGKNRIGFFGVRGAAIGHGG